MAERIGSKGPMDVEVSNIIGPELVTRFACFTNKVSSRERMS